MDLDSKPEGDTESDMLFLFQQYIHTMANQVALISFSAGHAVSAICTSALHCSASATGGDPYSHPGK